MENNQLEESFPVKGRATELSIINVQDLKAIGPYIWMGTRAAGLYRYHTQTHELKHFGSEEKVRNNSCQAIMSVRCILMHRKIYG